MAGGRYSVSGVFRVIDRTTRPMRQMETGVARFNQRATRGVRNLASAARTLGPAFAVAGAAIAAMAAGAVRAIRSIIDVGREFDDTMARAFARFNVRQGSEVANALESAALANGRRTEFGSGESGGALAALGAAGFQAQQAIAALPGVTDLATAGQLSLEEATSRAADTLGQWGLMTDDASQLAGNLTRANDVLAQASTNANLSITDVGDAFRDSAPAARRAGVSMEQTGAMIDVLAGAGIRGAQAGTALRGVLGRLNPHTRRARDAFRSLGIATRDADNNLRPAFDVLEDLRGALQGMGTADQGRVLRDIFGEERVSAAGVLVENVAAAREFEQSLLDSQGAAARMAETMRDTAGGDFRSLESSIEAFQLQLWSTIRGPLRGIVHGITEWVRANQDWISSGFQEALQWVQDHSEDIQAWIRRLAIAFAILAAVALAVSAFIALVAVIIIAVFVGIVAGAAWLVEQIIEVATVVGEALSSAFDWVWNRAVEVWTAIREFVVGALVLIGRAVRPYIQPIIDAFSAAVAWVRARWAPIGAWFSGIWQGIVTSARSRFSAFMAIVGRIVARLRAAWQPIGAFFTDLWTSIADSFNETVGGIVDAVSGFISNTRAVGRAELASQPEVQPQIVTSADRVARSITETTQRQEVEIVIRDDNERTDVRQRRPRGGSPVRVSRSAAL